MKISSHEANGFSLVEMLVAMALMSILGVIAMEAINMIRSTTEQSLRHNAHLEAHVSLVRSLTQGMTGIKGFELDDNLFYTINSSHKFKKVTNDLKGNDLLKYEGKDRSVTSHRYRKRVDTDLIEYYSVCIPVDQAETFGFKSIKDLRTYNLLPFISVQNHQYKVNCCSRATPDCAENILQDKPKYVLQTYRYETRTGSILPMINKGSWGVLSGLGFYIFRDDSAQRLLRANALSFFNECLSQQIIWKKTDKNCSHSLRIKNDQIVKDYDYTMEGVNQLGGDLGL